MKRFMSLIVLIALGLMSLNAFTVTVGSVWEGVFNFPVHTVFAYNYTQQIYTSSQINHQGQISKIRFYHDVAGSLVNSHDWVIYMGHVARSSFSSTTDWEPVANLTQVFSGSVLGNFPPGGQWMEITLDTPFNYNNTDNLVVAVHESTPEWGETVIWGGFTSGDAAGLYYFDDMTNPDVNNPPPAMGINAQLAAIQLVFPDTVAPPAPDLVYPDHNTSIMNGESLRWTLPSGSADATGYDVYIDGTLVSNNQASTQYTVSNLALGAHTWYVVARNNIGTSPPSVTRSFNITSGVVIGNGSFNSMMPITALYNYNYTQSIYLQSEINISNQRIESIAFYWNGVAPAPNSRDWVVYMGHVQRSQFANAEDWVPVGEMVQVFSGQLNLPDQPGWIEILLDNPFVYNNTDNLVVAVDENTPNCDGNEQYFYSTSSGDLNRGLRYYDDGINPDPNLPPGGTLVTAFPNIMLQFGDLPTSPILRLSPTTLNFGTVQYGQPNPPITVIASNIGSGTLNLSSSDFSLIGPNAAEFSFDTSNLPAALAPGQNVQIPVSVVGFTAGEITATLRAVYAGENYDVALTASVLPAGTIVIGDGTDMQRQPFGAIWGYERSAALYTVEQIGIVGTLHMVAWDCGSTSESEIPYKIWAKNTTATTLTAETWQSFTADATMVKQGTFTPNSLGWNTFQFDTPFAYTGANLIIAVESNYGGYGGGWGHNFRFTDIGSQRHQEWYQDGGEPTEPGNVNPYIPNIMMHLTSDIEDDLGAVSISGNTTPTVGQEASYTVRIRNNGSNNQSNYQVKLMGPGNTQLAVVNGPPINSGMTADVELLWTPSAAGATTIYGKVEMAGDEIAQNNQTSMLALNVQPEGVQGITIGIGNELARFPMDFWMSTSIYETLYMADELGFTTGTITSMALYNNFDFPVFNAATQIFLGSTNQTDLSTGFIPASQLTLVFDGFVDYPTGQNTINITFQTPYMHTAGNLVMMFVRPMDTSWYSFNDFFKCQTLGTNRARYDHNDNVIFDPFNPPEGNSTGQFPQVTFFYTTQLIENDLGVLGISGALTPTVGQEVNYTVTVKNNGTANQNTYTVKLMGPDDTVLASVAGPAINSMQTLEVVIPWTPTTEGEISIFGKVELAGDEIPANNQTAPIVINVQPAGISAVTIGNGTQNARIPMDFWYRNSLYETLYFADELGFNTGTITSLAFYNQFSTDVLNSATKIYLGSTDQNDLNAGFIPATQLTLVFDGNVDYPAGANTILYNLQTPYIHTGGNLVMMVNRPMDATWHSATNFFKCQTIGNNRARNIYDDNAIYDPMNPPAGEATGQFPKVTFFYTLQMIENDLGALSITGNITPTVGIASTYVIRIKNNGSEAQDTYTVKLMGPDNAVLASVNGPAINSQQIVEVEIPWTPTTSGNYAIYGKVELTGDEIATNNQTHPLNLMVNPAGVQSFTVGDGSQNARLPVDMYWNNSLFQTLYYPAEMGGFVGQITGLKFYNNFNSNVLSMPISVWLGTTTQTSLADGYIPSSQLTLVYEGQIDFPSGVNIININFNEPYLYVDGNNLVLMVYKTITQWYSSSDYFKCQTSGTDRSRNIYSDNQQYDPANPPADATLSGQFPMTTFMAIPGGVGDISGLVTGANSQPISGVTVSLNDGVYSTTTNAQGQYQLINVLPDTYTMSFNAHGYYEHTQTVVLEEDDELTINVTLQLLPQVSVTGTVLASDTGAGISGAAIQLRGYEPYNVTTNAAGSFTIPGVFADHTYDYNISAIGYTSANGQIIVGNTNYNMGEITLNEVAYAPVGVTAELNDIADAALVSWLAPDPNALEVVESFEAPDFPPEDWSQIITNDGPPNTLGVYPTWSRLGTLTVSGDVIAPTDGNFQAGLFWDYAHQDEWLITPPFNCPPSAYLRFDGYVYLGSTNGDHYYVKVSIDNGATWTVLWDASAQTPGWNEYSSPITIDLSAYSGNQLKVAFHAEDPPDNGGLWYAWYIDNVYIGNSTTAVQFSPDAFTKVSANPAPHQISVPMPLRALSRRIEEGGMRSEPRWPRPRDVRQARKSTRVLTGYMVYRLQSGQEQNESQWAGVTDEPITGLNTTDPSWAALANGDYRWAVKAVYTNGVTSVAGFSNVLNKYVQTGMIVGTVRRTNYTPIQGATVTNGTVSATTNSMGAYTLTVPIGYHSVTASAVGYDSLTVDDVVVNHNLATTVNFVLKETSNEDDYLPVLATALNGNYPNPFNPETTISYSLKEAGRVKLEVYNIKGQLVRTLIDEDQATGHYKLVFDAKDNKGRGIASGVYMLKMSAPGYKKTSKMILMQ